jgi:hypothetical protein
MNTIERNAFRRPDLTGRSAARAALLAGALALAGAGATAAQTAPARPAQRDTAPGSLLDTLRSTGASTT